jgi:hypothetical protein
MSTFARATKFNDVGNSYFRRKDYRAAWDLYKASLEDILSIERAAKQRFEAQGESNLPECNPYIQKAESMLAASNIPSTDSIEDAILYVGSITETNRREVVSKFDFYIYSIPFHIRSEKFVSPNLSHQAYRQLQSAKVIFNLAMVEQTLDRKSDNVVSLYKLASTLLDNSEDSILVWIAMLNNMGVWCYHNGDYDASQCCMEHLLPKFHQAKEEFERTDSLKNSVSHLDLQMAYRMMAHNIKIVLRPPGAASAAA